MGYTVAHAVVALPFARSRRWPASAVAAGAMAPDLPLWLRVGDPTTAQQYAVTHAWWAVPTVDVVLGGLLLLWWGVLLKPALVAVAPRALRMRLPREVPPEVPTFRPGMLAAIAFGALTHVTWDAFTHVDRLGSALLPVLNEPAGWFSVASWLQYGSSVVAMTVLLGAGALALRRARFTGARPELADGPRRALGAATALATAATLAAGLVAVGGRPAATVVMEATTGAALAALALLSAVGTALAVVRPRASDTV